MAKVTVKTERNKKPEYLSSMEQKMSQWTGMEGEDVGEALNDLSGNLQQVIGKMQHQVMTFIENDDSLTTEQQTNVKEYLRGKVNEMWRDIINHQSVGVDKLCIVIRRHIETNK